MEALIKEHTAKACEVIKFYFISPLDCEHNNCVDGFKPGLAHQVFGDSEIICGYKNLSITILLDSNLGKCLLKMAYESSLEKYNLKADNIVEKLRGALPVDFTQSELEYGQTLLPRDGIFKAFGTPKYYFYRRYNNVRTKFIAHLCSVNEPGFKEVHNRFQTLTLWYIDAANLIDLEDPCWEIIYLYYKKCTVPTVVGFCTIYKFYAHPDKIRARISQFIIFPPYQRRGVGLRFLRCIYNILRENPNLKDITVEDPSDDFNLLRSVNNLQEVLVSPFMSRFFENVSWDSAFQKEIASKLKLGRADCRRVNQLLIYFLSSHKKRVLKKSFFETEIRKHQRNFVRYNQQFEDEIYCTLKAEFRSLATKVESKIIEEISVVPV